MTFIKKYLGFLRKDRTQDATIETLNPCVNKKSVWIIKVSCAEYANWRSTVETVLPHVMIEENPIEFGHGWLRESTVGLTLTADQEDMSFMLLSTKMISAVFVRHTDD
jgi:hypothetical protein